MAVAVETLSPVTTWGNMRISTLGKVSPAARAMLAYNNGMIHPADCGQNFLCHIAANPELEDRSKDQWPALHETSRTPQLAAFKGCNVRRMTEGLSRVTVISSSS